ncbi:MAG: hypothetical protein ACK5KL_21675 [Dysgonomonas sp.]
METILLIIGITLVVVFSFIFGELGAVVLPRLSPKFERKPFNCRPCFTFHLHWLGMALIALIAYSWLIALSGVITAFIVFAIVWIIERKKVIE